MNLRLLNIILLRPVEDQDCLKSLALSAILAEQKSTFL